MVGGVLSWNMYPRETCLPISDNHGICPTVVEEPILGLLLLEVVLRSRH